MLVLRYHCTRVCIQFALHYCHKFLTKKPKANKAEDANNPNTSLGKKLGHSIGIRQIA
jgi:hypothetical protein